MAYELRPDSGSAFVNEKMESEKHPHFKGTALIGGVEYWHNIWKKKTRDGETWLSSSFIKKEPKEPFVAEPAWGSEIQRGRPATSEGDFDDEIPF